MSNLIGQSLGRYHILEQLGEGGMATVYKAYDMRLENNVAVKVIRVENLAPSILERSLKRFEREAKALAKLTHANIVNILDYGEFEGKPYLVMPYLPGGTLKQKLQGKPMQYQEAARLLIPIAKALAYAHQQGMVHRDVKPANILITQSGDPMLTDFGVAKIIDDEATMDLTGTSAAVGTPEYMAPEQITSKTVDHRADIYALGVVYYEMVTGRKPFTADTPMAVLFKHASEPLPRPRQIVPSLPEIVEHILIKALAKNPQDRYSDAMLFATALENLTNSSQVNVTTSGYSDKEEKNSLETKNTFAPNLQTSTQSNPRQEVPEQKIQAAAHPKSPSIMSRGMAWGVGVIGLIILALWIGSSLPSSAPSPVAATLVPVVAEVPVATEAAGNSIIIPTMPLPLQSIGTGNLKIVSSLPMTGSSLPQTQAIVNAMQLRLEQAGSNACGGKYAIEYEAWDDTSAELGKWDPAVETENANKAAADASIIAYLGTFNSGAAKLSIPILNQAGPLTMISPGNTNPGLTKADKDFPGVTESYYPTGIRSYSRVSIADDVQGRVAANFVKSLGVTTVFILDDQELYGKGVADNFEATAIEIGLKVVGRDVIDPTAADYKSLMIKISTSNAGNPPDAIYVGMVVDNNAAQLLKDKVAIMGNNEAVKYIGPDGIQTQFFIDEAGADVAEGVYASVAGVGLEKLPPAGLQFVKEYSAKFGALTEPYAVNGYETMNVALKAIEDVCAAGGDPTDRAAINSAVFAIRNFDGVFGNWSFDANGDTSLTDMTFYQVQRGAYLPVGTFR